MNRAISIAALDGDDGQQIALAGVILDADVAALRLVESPNLSGVSVPS